MAKQIELQWIDIPKIKDQRGNLSVLENGKLPFIIKRAYYLYDVPSGSYRGGHAHKNLQQIIIALSGSFEVVFKNGSSEKKILLNAPDKGLIIPTMTWREIQHFSSGAICLVVASEVFDESDYIRDWDKFLAASNASKGIDQKP